MSDDKLNGTPRSGLEPDAGPRILIISPNWIGDAVISQPLLQLIKKRHPRSRIDVLAPSWVAPAWNAMTEIDDVIEAPFRHGALQLKERWKFAKQLQKSGYAEAYVLPNTLKFALIPWLARIPKRIGYVGEMRYGLLNVLHRKYSDLPRPMVSFYAALADTPARAAPAPSELPKPRLSVPADRQAAVGREFGIESGTRVIVFAPGAEFGAAKRWLPEHFARLGDLVRQHFPEMQIVLLGSPKDRPGCDEIVALSPYMHNLAGVTSLSQAITLLARADAVVSNDSGLMNIASALNRPTLAIYGPTDYRHTPPFSDVAKALSLDLQCAPCHQRECPLGHHDCMKKLTPDMAWQPLKQMIDVR
jgi:heptosyltransferase-2